MIAFVCIIASVMIVVYVGSSNTNDFDYTQVTSWINDIGRMIGFDAPSDTTHDWVKEGDHWIDRTPNETYMMWNSTSVASRQRVNDTVGRGSWWMSISRWYE